MENGSDKTGPPRKSAGFPGRAVCFPATGEIRRHRRKGNRDNTVKEERG